MTGSKNAPPESMRWKLSKAVLALLAGIFVGIYGGHNLLDWYSTGQHWANFGSRGEPTNYKLITFTDHPLNLAFLLAIDASFVAVGCAAAVILLLLLLGLHKGDADH